MYRKVTESLKSWKGKNKRKPLVLKGARQVGKTYIVREFAKQEYEQFIEINLERSPKYGKLFEENDPQQIIKWLEIDQGHKIQPSQCLLFIDEIQEYPSVYQKLRYFYEEMPEISIIVAGSLLDFIFQKKSFSVPVGRLEFINLEPFSFYEYLEAKNESLLLNELKNISLTHSINSFLHDKALQLYFEYCIVGGMPEAIEEFIETNSFLKCEEVKANLLQTYREDFNKYAKKIDVAYIDKIYHTAIRQAGNKVKYVNIDREQPSAKISEVLKLLETAKLLTPIYHSSCSQQPLGSGINTKVFKYLFLDTGLYLTMCGQNRNSFESLEDIMAINSGRLFEQCLGRSLICLKKEYESRETFYWVREKKSSSAEVDFVVSIDGRIIPVEAKAGKSGRLKSLHYFVREKKVPLALRVNIQPPSLHLTKETLSNGEKVSFELLSLPIYLVENLETILANK